MKKNNTFHPDLSLAQKLIYQPCGLKYQNLKNEPESLEYAAATFEMNNLQIRFRAAKITPTKTGQFVTFWKRIGSGPIMPYDISDSFDFLVNLFFQNRYYMKKALCQKTDTAANELCVFTRLGTKLKTSRRKRRKYGNHHIFLKYCPTYCKKKTI